MNFHRLFQCFRNALSFVDKKLKLSELYFDYFFYESKTGLRKFSVKIPVSIRWLGSICNILTAYGEQIIFEQMCSDK